jgi:hypothetical protein
MNEKPQITWKAISSAFPQNENVKFGLNPAHIEIIEKELKAFGQREIDAKYVMYIWEKLGAELGWEPLRLCLNYFQYLEASNKGISIRQEQAEEKAMIKKYRKEGRLSGATKYKPFYTEIAIKFEKKYNHTDFTILYNC